MSKQLELALIGALELDHKASSDIFRENEIDESWFVDASTRRIYNLILGMESRGSEVDLLTVGGEITASCAGDNAQATSLLREAESAVDLCGSITMLQGYIDELREHRNRRVLTDGLHNILSDTKDDRAITSVDIAQRAGKLIESITVKRTREDESFYDIGRRVVDSWANRTIASGVPSRWTGCNRLLGSYPNGSLIYVAGRPSHGKTTKVTNQAAWNITHGHPTGIVTLEMTRDRIVKRMIGEMSSVSYFALDIGEVVTDKGREMLENAKRVVETFKTLPLYIADWPMSVDQIHSWAMHLKKMYGLEFLIIDRIELIRKPRGYKEHDPTRITSFNSGELQNIAKDLNVPVMCVTQLNRMCEVEHREPALYDLRQSGSLEQDATIVEMVYRDLQRPNDITWNDIQKSQDTRTGRIPMRFIKDINRLEENVDYWA